MQTSAEAGRYEVMHSSRKAMSLITTQVASPGERRHYLYDEFSSGDKYIPSLPLSLNRINNLVSPFRASA